MNGQRCLWRRGGSRLAVLGVLLAGCKGAEAPPSSPTPAQPSADSKTSGLRQTWTIAGADEDVAERATQALRQAVVDHGASRIQVYRRGLVVVVDVPSGVDPSLVRDLVRTVDVGADWQLETEEMFGHT